MPQSAAGAHKRCSILSFASTSHRELYSKLTDGIEFWYQTMLIAENYDVRDYHQHLQSGKEGIRNFGYCTWLVATTIH
jgi:hypothetical protein